MNMIVVQYYIYGIKSKTIKNCKSNLSNGKQEAVKRKDITYIT